MEREKLFLEMSNEIQVETMISAEEALRTLKAGRYDAVCFTYVMPVIDGISFLKILRAEGNSIPFVLFTGKGREEVVIEALNHGAESLSSEGRGPESSVERA